MKRLFEIRRGNNTMFFQNKMEAKTLRDEFNRDHPKEPQMTLHKGPDHRLYGVKGTQRTHSHNARSGGHGNGFPNKRK